MLSMISSTIFPAESPGLYVTDTLPCAAAGVAVAAGASGSAELDELNGGWGSADILLYAFFFERKKRMDPKAILAAKPLSYYRKGATVRGGGKMSLRPSYSYTLEADAGTGMAPDFHPYATPGEMLALGVFEGKYLNDCTSEFPREWYLYADALGTLSPLKATVECNRFKVGSR